MLTVRIGGAEISKNRVIGITANVVLALAKRCPSFAHYADQS